jgi:hypothetical protein
MHVVTYTSLLSRQKISKVRLSTRRPDISRRASAHLEVESAIILTL